MTLLNPLRKHCLNQVKTIARKIFECIMHISYRISALVHADKVLYYCPCCKLKLIEFVDGKFYERPERYNPMLYKTCQQDVLCPFCNSSVIGYFPSSIKKLAEYKYPVEYIFVIFVIISHSFISHNLTFLESAEIDINISLLLILSTKCLKFVT